MARVAKSVMRRNYHEGQRPDNEHFDLSANHWLSRRPALRNLCRASANDIGKVRPGARDAHPKHAHCDIVRGPSPLDPSQARVGPSVIVMSSAVERVKISTGDAPLLSATRNRATVPAGSDVIRIEVIHRLEKFWRRHGQVSGGRR
jgi:hypothetical protein